MQPISPLGRLPLGSYSDLAVTLFSPDGGIKKPNRRDGLFKGGLAPTLLLRDVENNRRPIKSSGSKVAASDVHQKQAQLSVQEMWRRSLNLTPRDSAQAPRFSFI